MVFSIYDVHFYHLSGCKNTIYLTMAGHNLTIDYTGVWNEHMDGGCDIDTSYLVSHAVYKSNLMQTI